MKAKTILAGFFMVVLGAAFAVAPLHDNPQPGCRPNEVCPDGTQKSPICVPGKTCPIKMLKRG